MKIALLTSIQSSWMYLILKGLKTWEIRKTLPRQINIDEGVWNFLYTTKAPPYIYDDPNDKYPLNGTVTSCYWFDEYRVLKYDPIQKVYWLDGNQCLNHDTHWFLKQACMTVEQLNELGKGKKELYASKIKDLKTLPALLCTNPPRSWKYIFIPKEWFQQ